MVNTVINIHITVLTIIYKLIVFDKNLKPYYNKGEKHMKKLFVSIIGFLNLISVTIILQLFYTSAYNNSVIIFMIICEVISNIFHALYLSLLFTEYVAVEIYKLKLISLKKSKERINLVVMIIYILLYFGKNTALLCHVPIYYIMLFYTIIPAWLSMAIYTKSNNVYINDKSIFPIKYNDKVDFDQIKDCVKVPTSINTYQISIKNSKDIFMLNLSKNELKILMPKLKTSLEEVDKIEMDGNI